MVEKVATADNAAWLLVFLLGDKYFEESGTSELWTGADGNGAGDP